MSRNHRLRSAFAVNLLLTLPGYPRPMRALPRLLAFAALSIAAMPAMAVKIERIQIQGLDEAMTENVRVSLSLQDSIGKVVSGRRMAYLVRVAEDETREALEPFGYYSPSITIQRSDRSAPESDTAGVAPRVQATGAAPASREPDPNRPVSITITVRPGEPVKVRNETVAIEGDASDDRYLNEEIDAFLPQPGAVLDHVQYEASKARITRRLAERGYFDADFIAHRVEVTRAQNAADIDLRWSSGDRYDMGPVSFAQTPRQIIRPQLLDKLVYWNEGEYYHQGRLDRLRDSLLKLDYFSAIDIEPRPDEAVTVAEEGGSTSRRVPVTVTLTPAKRSIYTAGVSYGTDSGPGVSFGVERRYVNSRGHKALAQVDWAQNRKTATLQYRIPAFAWLDGWYTASAQFADEQTDYIDTRRVELVGSRSGQYNRKLNLIASIHALRERWAYEYESDGDPDTPVVYRYANYFFPALRAEYADVDDRFAPRRGIGGTVMVRAGSGKGDDSGGDAMFAQAHVRASWFKGLGPSDRLIVRGELGHTFTDALNDLPPSLRFYAGGDRSIRGYNWREVGPRVFDDEGDVAFALGARNVITASVEYERYFAGPWGAAAFVDTGDAFDGGSPDMHTGVGIGLRWKSPVGPIRIDIARGLDDPDSPFTLHLNIGTDL
jgi:translocation and assembly module TamA